MIFMSKKFKRNFLSRAKKLLEDGFCKEAEKELTDLSKRFPKEGEIFYLLSQSLFKQEKFQEALKSASKSVSLNPHRGDSYHIMGYCYFYLQDFSNSEKNLLRAMELKPEDPHINYLLGHLYAGIKEGEKSIEHFNSALEKGATYPDIYEKLGEIFFELGEYEKATGYFKSLLMLKPEDPLLLYMIGRCHLNGGNYKEAVKFITESIKAGLTGPELNKGRYILALAHCGNKRFNSAEKIIRQALKEEPSYYDYYSLLGRILISRIDYRRGRKIFKKALELKIGPEDEVLFYIAFTFILENRLPVAIEKLENLLNKWQNNVKAHYTLAHLFYNAGEADKAKYHWQRCMEIAPVKLKKKAEKKLEKNI